MCRYNVHAYTIQLFYCEIVIFDSVTIKYIERLSVLTKEHTISTYKMCTENQIFYLIAEERELSGLDMYGERKEKS